MKINSAMIESYVRNLIGQVIGAVTIVTATSNVSVSDFGSDQWSLVANALWASLVPVILRYVNKKDPAFGIVAQAAVQTGNGADARYDQKQAAKSVAKKATPKKKAAAK